MMLYYGYEEGTGKLAKYFFNNDKIRYSIIIEENRIIAVCVHDFDESD